MRKQRKQIKKIETKKTGVACLASFFFLTGLLLFGQVPLLTYAGPADEIAQAQSQPQTQPGPILNEPIVNPKDVYSYDQMVQDLQALAARYPGKMTLQEMGVSLDGRKLYHVIVGNPESGCPILVQGAIHGREYIVTPLMMQQIETLLAEYDSGECGGVALSYLLSQGAIHFVPMVNPDGVTISQQGFGALFQPELQAQVQNAYAQDLAEGRTSLSYEVYQRRWKSNGRGVDLNHNFDAEWESISPALQHGSWEGYRGPAILSEPESYALAQLTQRYPYQATVSYHAMGNVIYWNTEGNQKTAESYALAQLVSSVTGYRILSDLGVGGFKDWHQRTEGAAAEITIEVGKTTCPVQFAEYPQIWAQNKEVPALVLKQAMMNQMLKTQAAFEQEPDTTLDAVPQGPASEQTAVTQGPSGQTASNGS